MNGMFKYYYLYLPDSELSGVSPSLSEIAVANDGASSFSCSTLLIVEYKLFGMSPKDQINKKANV